MVLALACRHAEPQPTSASAAPSATAPPPRDAAWLGEAQARHRRSAAELRGRLVRAAEASLLPGTVGPRRQPRFRITNRGQKKLVWLQSWVIYYDAAGATLDRFPQAVEVPIPPGASVERALGYPGSQTPPNAQVAECEIPMVEWDDGTKWSNDNLEPAPDRKPGGLSSQELVRREGEMVLAKWTGRFGPSGRPLFLLANVSTRPLETRSLISYYYANDGEQLDRVTEAKVVTLGRDATAEVESGSPKSELEAGTTRIELTIPAVQFSDGPQEAWSNENLAAAERPARATDKP